MTRFLAACALAMAVQSHAALVEVKRWVPAKASDGWGREFSRDIMVTVFYEGSVDGPRPVVILNHGRASTAAERHGLGRAAYLEASKWFVKRGFLVAVPTRIGYGVTGGPDVEDTGGCASKRYEPGYAASAAQTLTVLEYLRAWKEADLNRVLVAGQSFGGTTAITIAAMDVPGVKAAINFAGGGGGRPATHPGDPCSPQGMKRLFESYGKTARIPTLWVYSENDEYFGPKHPRDWFEAFRRAGGRGEFVSLPPYQGGGHGSFTKQPEAWQPPVAAFLDGLSASFAETRSPAAPRAKSD
jgi:dienelactone hydrolase